MQWNSALSKLARMWTLVPALLALPALAQDARPFTNEQLDQMTAQIALYPDPLLSQVLMATTYPEEFAAAAKWSKAHPDARGDDAVKMVEGENWDPAVASLVGFPEVLITFGDKPDWVKNIGDAFLAQPEDVMDSVQRLRAQADKAGNLKSNEQVKVSKEAAEPAPAPAAVAASAPPPQVIVIEPAQPSVVYVPTYNPAVVYGPWLYPAYPPYYYPPPPGYWWSRTIATGIAWGVGIGVSNALWGGFNWGRGDVNINVNRYNNINVNQRLDVNSNRTSWNHNPQHRQGNYRGGDATRQKLDKQYNSGNREQYRGRDNTQNAGRDASRERAAQTMQNRGVSVDQSAMRDRAQSADRSAARGQAAGMDRSAMRESAQSADRSAARDRASQASRDNALRGANSGQARAQMDRGAASQRVAERSSGAGMSRPSGGGASRPSGGGGGRAGGGGGGRGGGGRGR